MLAVTHHGDGIGEGEDFLQPVRDVKDGNALVTQTAGDAEEALHLVVRQRGRGFVHDQHADVQGNGAGDFHRLLFGQRQLGGGTAGVERHAKPGDHRRGLVIQGGPVDQGRAVLVADEDVLGDRQVGEDHRFLIDRGHPGALGVGGAAKADGLAIDHNLAGVGLVDASHRLDQRRLARPVFTDQRVNAPGL